MVDKIIAIDTEYYQHNGKLHRPGGKFACLTTSEGKLQKDRFFNGKKETRTYLKTLQKRPNTLITMQNALYDIRQLTASGLWPNGWEPEVWDTMLVEQGIFGGLYQLNSLQDLSRRWLGIYLQKDIVSKFSDASRMTRQMQKYALDDALVTMRIATAQKTYVDDQFGGDFDWYNEIDLPAMWAILNMPPVRIDVDGWLKHGRDLYKEGVKIEQELGFNVKSGPQVKDALRATGIRPGKSVDVNALEKFLVKAQNRQNAKQVVLLTSIMRARKCRDAMSKYGEDWIDKNVENKEWIYPNWNVTGAETGRMSCSKPNMQNIPKRGQGSIYRSFFLASTNGRLLVGDVQQQEPRFSAFLSHDPNLTEEILNGTDLHQKAADLFGITGRGARSRGKALNLGLNYGMSAYGLAGRAEITVEEAEQGIDARKRHYNRYYAWQDRQVRAANSRGYVNTVTGRPVWLNKYNFQYKNNALNAPVQGSAADHTKLALRYIREECASRGIKFCVNLVVHDEIVMDVPPGMMKTYRYIMSEAWKEAGHKLMPTIPTEIEMKSGHNWRVHE